MKYGLIGKKLGHSYSKEIHERIFGEPYELCELSEEELETFLRKKAFRGINVTIPYKEKVIPFLDECDETARRIGAVNTIVRRDGKLIGYNTDYLGFRKLLEKHTDAVSDDVILILGGTSGTAKTVSYVLREMGAMKIYLVTRNKENAEEKYPESSESFISYEEAKGMDATVIINTTPVGMYPDTEEVPMEISGFSNLRLVLDVIYNPLRTKLVSHTLELGIDAEGGFRMLFEQALEAGKIFRNGGMENGENPICEPVEKIYFRLLKEKENIVLIGMPGSGKSTIGKILSEKLHRELTDTDAVISEKAQKTIKEIFEENGEQEFRKMESDVISEIMKTKKGAVIATGGGSILDAKNRDRIRSNSRIYYLNRDIKKLAATEDRPLASTFEDIQRLYEERRALYTKLADVIIDGDAGAEDVAEDIIRDFENRN